MMSATTSVWWPEDRVKATLCPNYVFSHLPSNTLPRLVAPLPWGEGLTNETYLDWILSKAGRLFLILVDIGAPDCIFRLVDESFDDSDLPIAAHSVSRLQLPSLDKDSDLDSKFFLAQWRFVVRGIEEGSHIKYTENEGVPVEVQNTGTALTREGVEKVVLAGAVCRTYLRTQVTIGGAPHFYDENEVLEEIASLKRLAHDHVYSIYASYFVDNTVCILFTGIYERSLWSFLNDTPQSFKRLPKDQRRQILINWPHCLAHGLSWLHAHGQVHGLIRPSNILIDADFKIFIGQFEALDTLLPPVKVNDVESYQYGPPERWVRSISIQNQGQPTSSLPSGGRTGRKNTSRPSMLTLSRLRGLQISENGSRSPPESVVSHGTVIRVGDPGNPASRFSFGIASSSSGSSNGSVRKHVISMKRPIFYSPSITSSNSSGSSEGGSLILDPVGLPAAHTSGGALVQVWQSRQTDPEAGDIFSLGAVILDIFTFLCKRKISAFASHRGAKNRTAGRGGGVADCSFHLDRNIGQVSSWIALLEGDAKKHKDPIFQVLRPMLAMSRDMLSHDPAYRPSAFQVEQLFSYAIQKLESKLTVHCKSNLCPRPSRARPNGPPSQKSELLAVPRIQHHPRSVSPGNLRRDYFPRDRGRRRLSPIPSSQSTSTSNLSSLDASESQSNSDTDSRGYERRGYASREFVKPTQKMRYISPDRGSSPVAANDPSWDYRAVTRA